MQEFDIGRIDLNLLKVFTALMADRSVTVAADRLGLAQSTVSHSLARLRAVLNDPVFVRSSQGMQPTGLAEALAEPIATALAIVQEALDKQQTFDPTTSSRTFNILMTDAGEMLFIPPLMARLRGLAPNIRIVVSQRPREAYKDALENGAADIAIGQLPQVPTDLYQTQLSLEPFEGFARAGHPILANPSKEVFLAADHLIIGRPAVAEAHIVKALGPAASKRRIALELSHYMPAAFVLAETDLIAVMPRTISNFLTSRGSLRRFPPPFDIEPVIIRQFWHGRSHHDKGCRWLRTQVTALFQHARRPESGPAAVASEGRQAEPPQYFNSIF